MPTRSEKNRVELEKQKKLVEQVVQAFAQHQSKELESRRDAITAAVKRAVEKEIKHALKKGLKKFRLDNIIKNILSCNNEASICRGGGRRTRRKRRKRRRRRRRRRTRRRS